VRVRLLTEVQRFQLRRIFLKTQVSNCLDSRLPTFAMNSTPTYSPPGQQHIPGPPPPFQPGSGPCGLTGHEWHMFLVFVTLLVFVFGISFVVAWSRAEDVSDIWLQAKHCVQATKMGTRYPRGPCSTYLVYCILICPPVACSVVQRTAQTRTVATRRRQSHRSWSRRRPTIPFHHQLYLGGTLSLHAPSARPMTAS
jgi:hypothetical protein